MTPPDFPDRDDPAAPALLAGRPRVLVVGAGAIGGVVAAKLARAGHDVTALDANREHVARLTSPGLRLDELGTPSVVPVPAVAGLADLRGPFDFALLTLKAPFLEPVLTGLVSRGLVRTFVSLGNGLIQPRVADADRPRAAGALAALLSRLGPTKASMSQDLERGSPTEVDVINGAVVTQAAALGRTAPLNQRVVELVHECERGARRPGRDTLAALRAALGPAASVRHLSPEPGARHG